MFACFGAMHVIAARRGDGLRPELVDLLKRSRADAELSAQSSFPLRDDEPAAATAFSNAAAKQVDGDAHALPTNDGT